MRGQRRVLVNIQKPWDRLRKAAGLEDVRIHDLRHSFASFGANAGDSLLVIGALLGRRSAKSTERYANLAAGPVQDAAQRISGEIAELWDDRRLARRRSPISPH
jgi:integrase